MSSQRPSRASARVHWVRDTVSETLIDTGCSEGVDLRDWMVCRVFLLKEAHIDRFPHRN